MYRGNSSKHSNDKVLEGAITKMKVLGYDETVLQGFTSTELNIMFDRIVELNRIERADALLERLNNK